MRFCRWRHHENHRRCESADNVSFIVCRTWWQDRFVGGNELAKPHSLKFYRMEPDSGSYKWGVTTSQSYFSKRQYRDFRYRSSDRWLADTVLRDQRCNLRTRFLGRMLCRRRWNKNACSLRWWKVRVLLPHDDHGYKRSDLRWADWPSGHGIYLFINNGLIKFPELSFLLPVTIRLRTDHCKQNQWNFCRTNIYW